MDYLSYCLPILSNKFISAFNIPIWKQREKHDNLAWR